MRKRYFIDLAERIAATFAQGFIGLLLLSGAEVSGIVDFSTLKKAAIAGVMAVLSLVKGMLASRVGDKNSASLAKPPIVEP